MIHNLPPAAFDFPPANSPAAGPHRQKPAAGHQCNRFAAFTEPEPIIVPFSIVADVQEKAPYSFTGILADSDKRYRPLVVHVIRESLGNSHADYTISGPAPDGTPFAQLIALERKSIPDAVGTILGYGDHRRRFEKELEWLNGRDFAAVVVEGEFSQVLQEAEARSSKGPGIAGKNLFRSVLTWQQRYPRVHWQWCPDRRFAEVYVFRALEKFWEGKMKNSQPTATAKDGN